VVQLAAEQLLARGCRRFLHVGFSRTAGRRAVAFREVLAKYGHSLETYDFDVKLEEQTESPDLSRDLRALKPFLEASPHPLGVLAVSDPFARAVWKVCD
jgi:DNA-binding LacI/PurR family transcriptional regulator